MTYQLANAGHEHGHDAPAVPSPLASARPYPSRSSLVHTLDAKLGPGNRRRIARAAGVTAPHVSRVLRGRCGASLKVLQAIARGAGVSTDELLAYIGEHRARTNKGSSTTGSHDPRPAAEPPKLCG